MKKIILIIIGILLSVSLVSAIPNPASVYCEEQNGSLVIETNGQGNQNGICIINGEEINEWDLFRNRTQIQEKVQLKLHNNSFVIANNESSKNRIVQNMEQFQNRYNLFSEKMEGIESGNKVTIKTTNEKRFLWLFRVNAITNYEVDDEGIIQNQESNIWQNFQKSKFWSILMQSRRTNE